MAWHTVQKTLKLTGRSRSQLYRDMPAENPQLDAIQTQLNDLQQTVTLVLEDKAAREAENRQRDEERALLQAEISRLTEALIQATAQKGWFSRFRRKTE